MEPNGHHMETKSDQPKWGQNASHNNNHNNNTSTLTNKDSKAANFLTRSDIEITPGMILPLQTAANYVIPYMPLPVLKQC